MKRLENMAIASKIKREDLPKETTKEAWELLIKRVRDEVKENAEDAKAALQLLGTGWDEIETSLFNDPQNYLISLFDLKGPVSDTEAKFKALFNNILSKNSAPRNSQFFTEQEEVFIQTMRSIQYCKGGKQEGIAAAYQLLDASYKYKLQLSPPMTAEELSNLEKREEVTQFLRNFVQDQEVITEEELIKCFNKNTYDNSRIFSALFGANSREYFTENEEDYTYQLNEVGAREALSYIRDIEEKNLINYIAEIIQSLMERTISDDTFIQELAGEIIDQGVHYSIYLKNLIGHLIGLTNQVIFDRHSGVLSSTLLEKTREDILELFFKKFTPEILVEALVRRSIPDLYMKLFSNEKRLTEKEAKNLLEKTGYLIA